MKKRILSMLLAIVMVAGLMPGFAITASAAESYTYPTSQPTTTWTGSGTESAPYVITTAQQMADLAWMVNNNKTDYISANYRLGGNIDLSGGTWTPIGYNTSPARYFSGTFDGGSFTISGLNNVTPVDGNNNVALFGAIQSGTVKNLTVSGTFTTSYNYVAGICAYSSKSTFENCVSQVYITCTSTSTPRLGGIIGYGSIDMVIRNCTNSGTISYTGSSTDGFIGGIAGHIGKGTVVSGCSNSGTVTGKSSGNNGTAGIVGYANDSGTATNTEYKIENCTNSGVISGTNYVGGVVGYSGSGDLVITGCANSAAVTGSGHTVGGICGCRRNVITGCYNTGNVTGQHNVGGICGNLSMGDHRLSNCYNTGNITATAPSTMFSGAGGIEGYTVGNKTADFVYIDNCYNTGTVSGKDTSSWYIGGISGRLQKGILQNCHSTGEIAKASSSTSYCGSIAGGSGTVTNSYYLNGTDKKATQKTADEFADGAVYNLLQGANGSTQVWGQTIGTDSYPVFFNGCNLPKPAHEHSWTYNAVDDDGDDVNDTITATCTAAECTFINGNGGSVSLAGPQDAQIHTGSAITPITISYSDDWTGSKDLEVVYTKNTNLGTATGTLTLGTASVSVNYDIVAEITLNANGGTCSTTSILTNKDGKLTQVLPADVTHQPLFFNGWYDSVTGGTAVTNETVFKGSTTIYAQFVAHEHNWSYIASDANTDGVNDTITAVCSNVGDTCPDTNGGSVTIEAPASLAYTGNAIEAVVTNNLVDTTIDVNVVYTAASGSELTEGKPVKVGTYTASITLDDATAEVTFEIKPAPVVTGIDFNRTSPAYDAATNTFYVSDDFPFELTVTGEYLTMLQNAGGLEAAFYGDTQNAGGTWMGMTIDSDTSANGSYNTDSLTYAINNAGGGSTYIKSIKVGDKWLYVNLKYAPLFTLTINSSENGSIKHDHTLGNEIPEDVEVTLKVSPNSGYELETLIVDGQNVTTQVSDGKYKFTMPDNDVTVSATFKALPHTHDWKYELVNASTIKAVCGNIDGRCPNTDGGSVTIAAPVGSPLEYNGAVQGANLFGSFATGVSNNDIVITYADNKSPINVGEYTASIEVDGATARVTYSIKQKDVTIKADDQTITYGESLTANAVTISGLIDGHTVTGVTLTPSITNVGTGTITPSAAVIMNGTEDVTANYNISYAVGTLTINAASMTGVSAVGYANAYDGKSHGITVTAPAGSTITYSTDDITYSAANPTYTDVCEITVFYKVEKENYETVPGSAVVKITPLDISTAEVTLGDALTYNGSEQTQTVAEVKVGDLTVDANAYAVTNNTATNAGTEYELTVTAKENSNFTGTVKKSFNVAQKGVSVSAGTYKVSKIYDGTTNAGTASGVLAISGILDASGVTVTATPEAYSNANVGGQSTVNVSLTLSGDTNNNYVLESATLSVPCEITKKDIAIESADVSDKDYNGSDAAEVTAVTFKDVVTGETLAIGTDYTVTSAVFPDANADAENQTVTISVTLTDSVKANNYNLTNGTGFAVVNAAKINKIDYPNTITADTTVRANKAQNDLTFYLTDKLNGIDGAAIKSVAYGSNDKNLLAGTPTGSGKAVTYHVNNGTAVGDTGVIEVTVSSTNYNDFVVAVTVTTTDKDTLTITGVKMDAEMYTYGGAAVCYDNSALSVTGTTGVAFDNNDLEYVYSGTLADGSTYAESTVAPTKAGTYTLTVRVPADNLDYTGKQEISFTIGAKKITRPAQASAVVYNGAEQTYGVASTTEYTVTGGVQRNANETGYDVTIALTDKFNTVWDNGTTDDLTHKFIINKKAITITADDKEAYAGSRQPELTYTVDGLIEGDKLTTEPTLTTDANMNRVGTYTITASGADAGSNYTISYVNGTLTVEMFYFPIITPRYDVEIADDITGGDVSANKTQAYKGDTITITVAPDAEYQLIALTVTDSRGNAIALTKVSDTKYTFKMPGYDVVIDAAFAKIETPAPADPTVDCPRDWTCPMYGYIDLDRAAWYHNGVHFCIESNLMQGIGNNEFAPNGTTTRAMIVTILWRLEGSPVVNYAMDFEDVEADQWYTEAIRWAASEKIVEGYGNGKFGTNDAITREQFVTIMFRYAKYKGYDVSVGENTNILSYDDAFDVAEWAIPAMQWACGSGMIQGIADGNQMNLAPQGNATRAQAAAILQRFCENVADKE